MGISYDIGVNVSLHYNSLREVVELLKPVRVRVDPVTRLSQSTKEIRNKKPDREKSTTTKPDNTWVEVNGGKQGKKQRKKRTKRSQIKPTIDSKTSSGLNSFASLDNTGDEGRSANNVSGELRDNKTSKSERGPLKERDIDGFLLTDKRFTPLVSDHKQIKDFKLYYKNIKDALNLDGMLLENFSPLIKDLLKNSRIHDDSKNKWVNEVVEIALKNNGLALQFAPEEYKNNEAMVRIAMNQEIDAYRFSSEKVQTSKEILMYIAEKFNIKLFESDYKSSKNKGKSRWTLHNELRDAVRDSDLDRIEMILEMSSNINQLMGNDQKKVDHKAIDISKQTGSDRENVVFIAARNGHLECFKALLKFPGALSLITSAGNSHGQTPFNVAFEYGCVEIVRWHLDYCNFSEFPHIKLLKETIYNNGDRWMLNAKILELLVNHKKINISDVDKDGNTILHILLSYFSNNDNNYCKLVKSHKSISHVFNKLHKELINVKNNAGNTVLHNACIEYQLHAVQLFLETPGVDVNQLSDDTNYTPLQIVLQGVLINYNDFSEKCHDKKSDTDQFINSLYDSIGTFLEHEKFNPNVLSQSTPHNKKANRSYHMPGMSILHMICSEELTNFTNDQQLLLLSELLADRHQLNINLQVDYDECTDDIPDGKLSLEGMTPLMLAIHFAVETATVLLLNKEDINLDLTTKKDKNSALHLLFITSNFQVAQKLSYLKNIIKLEPNITKNAAGKTPLDLLDELLNNQSSPPPFITAM